MKKKKDKPKSICLNCNETFDGQREFCVPRCRKMNELKQVGATKFRKGPLASLFQRMIRAEYGAQPPGYSLAVRVSEVVSVHRHIGQCVCITCARVFPWTSQKGVLNTGHFVAGRGASIIFEETNVAPQCAGCNRNGGEIGKYRLWMEAVRGVEEIERLMRLRNSPKDFTRDELVDKWFEYSLRLKAARVKMKELHES